MTIKTTGAELKRFWADDTFWATDTYIEEEVITVNGQRQAQYELLIDVPDDALVTISGGFVYDPAVGPEGQTLEAYFKRWRKQQSTTTIAIECDISKRDAIVAAIKAAGGKVL